MNRIEYSELAGSINGDHQGSFIIIEHDGTDWFPRTAIERQVSERIDMADCHGDGYRVYFVDPADGRIRPVHFGNRNQIGADQEFPFEYATTELIIIRDDGSVWLVGYVVHTDH